MMFCGVYVLLLGGSVVMCFCFQAEDGIRYLVRSRGLGDVYKRQTCARVSSPVPATLRPDAGGNDRAR